MTKTRSELNSHSSKTKECSNNNLSKIRATIRLDSNKLSTKINSSYRQCNSISNSWYSKSNYCSSKKLQRLDSWSNNWVPLLLLNKKRKRHLKIISKTITTKTAPLNALTSTGKTSNLLQIRSRVSSINVSNFTWGRRMILPNKLCNNSSLLTMWTWSSLLIQFRFWRKISNLNQAWGK